MGRDLVRTITNSMVSAVIMQIIQPSKLIIWRFKILTIFWSPKNFVIEGIPFLLGGSRFGQSPPLGPPNPVSVIGVLTYEGILLPKNSILRFALELISRGSTTTQHSLPGIVINTARPTALY